MYIAVYIAKREEIERRRLASGLNKKELSLKAGLPANAIGRIERGESEQTHPLRARAISKALHCDVTDIFTEAKGEAV
nr:MAG TPA: helix-turn-helix protein [Caudoviricetes sp.]